MSILVTGGLGFIGSNFIRQWLIGGRGGGERVVNLDKVTYAAIPATLADLEDSPDYIFVRGDIADTELVKALLIEHQPRAIINFAAESHVDRSIDGASPFIHTNVIGTYRLLDSALAHWRGLDVAEAEAFRFLHVSTDEVYGTLEPTDPAFTEETRFAPNSPYAATKAASDHLVRAWNHTFGLPTLTSNCSNNYGPWQFPEKLIPLIISNALAGRPLPIYGDGQQVRDWLFVTDHCEALATILERGVAGETYNVGGSNQRPNLEVVGQICDILQELQPRAEGSYRDLITFVKDRLGHDRRYAVDGSKITRELGWRPLETFDTGLKKTVEWYLGNGDWISQAMSENYKSWLERKYGVVA
jgi:dTDP-glucose 4,6-dehydratase